VRPLTEGKLQAGSVRQHRGKVNKKEKEKEKVAKYIEASAVAVKNGARKVRKRAKQRHDRHRKWKSQKKREAWNAVSSARNFAHAW